MNCSAYRQDMTQFMKQDVLNRILSGIPFFALKLHLQSEPGVRYERGVLFPRRPAIGAVAPEHFHIQYKEASGRVCRVPIYIVRKCRTPQAANKIDSHQVFRYQLPDFVFRGT
jgi:hypothetical protein